MPARRSGQAELRSFIQHAEPKYLTDHLELLAAPLGLTPEDVEQLRLLEPEEVARALRGRLEGQRAASQAARARDAEKRASAAASTLGDTACWQGTSAQLDVRALLIDLPAHPTARLIGFEGPGLTPTGGRRSCRGSYG